LQILIFGGEETSIKFGTFFWRWSEIAMERSGGRRRSSGGCDEDGKRERSGSDNEEEEEEEGADVAY
jgi:hypothetical protein